MTQLSELNQMHSHTTCLVKGNFRTEGRSAECGCLSTITLLAKFHKTSSTSQKTPEDPKEFLPYKRPGSVFPVNTTVGHLKKKIKEDNPNTIRFNAALLKIYLAKDRGRWLNANDSAMKALGRREILGQVKNLMQKFEPAARDIHVLVEMPKVFFQVLRRESECSCCCCFPILTNV
ncbi:hypothetical protein P3T76_007236 [Phytophthora citrophthora]|uniref:Crinkler effector protein N-terminal domain-containing protein n=1 Tax=Phytophthora citrophthora TaxID=4793 RepID=A0AAD9GMX0_9STRA|nr:hypothetical protein P3T76_007236 [Phytophthora citrophthora]